MNETKLRFLFHLDCLLDTRFATLITYEPNIKEYLTLETYQNRLNDYYEILTNGKINQEKYNEMYINRDKETLKKARLTSMIYRLKEISNKILISKEMKLTVKYTQIGVNIYPYSLNKIEKKEIVNIIKHYAGPNQVVKLYSIPLNKLTPTYIFYNWEGVSLYNFDDWYKIHYKESVKVIMPRNICLTPRLFLNKEINLEDLVNFEEENVDPFELVRIALVANWGINHLPVKEYCFVTKK